MFQLFMKRWRLIGSCWSLLWLGLTPGWAETLWQNDFSVNHDMWIRKTNQGRAMLAGSGGERYLQLDDASSDAVYSLVTADFEVDLTSRRNVRLSFRAKSLGNESHPPPNGNFTAQGNFDAVTITTDGGWTWRSVQSLAEVGSAWETFSLTLDSAINGLGGGWSIPHRTLF